MPVYKLTEVDKAYIIKYWNDHYDKEAGPRAWCNKMLTRKLAQMFGVHTDTIGDIRRGRSWRDDGKYIRHNTGTVEDTLSKTHVPPQVYKD